MRESAGRSIWKSELNMADRLDQALRGEEVRVREGISSSSMIHVTSGRDSPSKLVSLVGSSITPTMCQASSPEYCSL